MSLGFTLGISLAKTPSNTALRADAYPEDRRGLRTRPASRPRDRVPPASQELLALGVPHGRLVAGRFAPHLADLLGGPLPGGNPRQVRGAERRGLDDLRNDHGHAEHVGLELHQPGVGDGAAVRLELGNPFVGGRLLGAYGI